MLQINNKATEHVLLLHVLWKHLDLKIRAVSLWIERVTAKNLSRFTVVCWNLSPMCHHTGTVLSVLLRMTAFEPFPGVPKVYIRKESTTRSLQKHNKKISYVQNEQVRMVG